MAARDIHVVPDRQGGWAVAVEGPGGTTTHYPSQRLAILAGTAKAQRDKVELIIHGSDGGIQQRKRFGT